MTRYPLLALTLLLLAAPAFATTFIVPDDAELIAKSDAIVIGTVEGRYVQETIDIETVYELRIERTLKGRIKPDELVRIVSPGGDLPDRITVVHGSAHFANGERVLLFLIRDRGRWATTDLTLGKFRFETSTTGARMLVRDSENIVGWDRAGRDHVERVRREAPFVRFIEQHVAGQKAAADYYVSPSEVTLRPNAIEVQPHAPAFPAFTYTDNRLFNGNWIGARWDNMAAGAVFSKRTSQNAAGVADGGVSVIQNAMASWNAECASNINLVYGGERETPSAGQDGVSIIEFNDPQGRIPGPFGGSGTVATTFLSYWNPHSFASQTWWSIRDADIVFQDNYSGTHHSFPSAMTHELGHGIGWRHSNADYRRPNNVDEPCNPAIEECSSAAVMTPGSAFGYTLQPWDVNAAQAVYPGGTCGPICTAPAITSQPTSRTINAGTSTTLTVAASGTGPLSYQWYVGASGNTASPIGGATSTSLTVSPGSTTSYWVRVTNACGVADSATATVTVNAAVPCPTIQAQPLAQAAMMNTPFTMRVTANGSGLSYQWYRGASGNTSSPVAGATAPVLTAITTVPAQSYWVRVTNSCGSVNSVAALVTPMQTVARIGGDYDGDGRTDRVVYRPSTTQWFIMYATGVTTAVAFGRSTDFPVPADYDGDGRTDIAIYRPSDGTWWFRLASGASTPVISMGRSDDIPVPADYDGDGDDDPALYRRAEGTWFIRQQNGSTLTVPFGAVNADLPVPGDYNGDGRADLAVWRQSNGTWFVQGSNSIQWGAPGDLPVPADFDGDGTADIAVWRPSTGIWYLRYASQVVRQFGLQGDVPVPTNINGDTRAEMTVWRPANGRWFTVDPANANNTLIVPWGAPGDIPLTQ